MWGHKTKLRREGRKTVGGLFSGDHRLRTKTPPSDRSRGGTDEKEGGETGFPLWEAVEEILKTKPGGKSWVKRG